MENSMMDVQPVPQEVVAQALDLAKQSFNLLSPYLVALTPADRKKMLKMNNGTEPFVSQGIQYITDNGKLVPNYVDVDSLKSDYATFTVLNPLLSLLTEYSSQVSDTKMVAGGSAYNWVLAFYDSIKTASKKRVPGAKTIYDELKKRFTRKKKKTDKKEETANPNADTAKPDADSGKAE